MKMYHIEDKFKISNKSAIKLEKVMLISVGDGWWYIVVEFIIHDGKLCVNCICDNANNIYSWEWSFVTHYMSANEIENHNPFGADGRVIPHEVIARVLFGKCDDRFYNNFRE